MPRWMVLLNAQAGSIQRAGGADLVETIGTQIRGCGIEVQVRLEEGRRIPELARSAAADGFDAVIAGGGDGTINSVASAVRDTPAAFGVLPLGTHNHFAKELGIPLDLEPAIEVLAKGEARPLPVGEVNGKLFLNFSAIGLHPEVVDERERSSDAPRSKVLATVGAGVRVLQRMPLLHVKLRLPDKTLRRLTPSVIVCNNRHQMEAFGVEESSVTDRRLLNVYIARKTRAAGMAWLVVRALAGMAAPANGFEVHAAPEFSIHLPRRRVTASLDGELVRLTTPLRFRVREKGLRVIGA